MIVRDGAATSFLIMFPNGDPDGNISWQVLAPSGSTVSSGTLVVPADAVSIALTIPGADNTLTGGALFSYRDVTWSYTVNGIVVNDEHRYTIEARLPFGVSPAGVRNKLGVDIVDLPDTDIELVKAYLSFQTIVGGGAAITAVTDGGANDLAIRDAIEASAALMLIPTMPVRISVKEASVSNSFQRQDVDWTMLAIALDALVSTGILVVDPTFDLTEGFGGLFLLATPATDPFTGAASNTGA